MLYAASAQIDITPDSEVFLAGSFQVRQTAKVLSHLYASCIVLENDGTRAAWVACDLLFLSDEIAGELRRQIAERLGTSFDNVFISCTHTHNGPSLFKSLPPVEPDGPSVLRIKEQIVQSSVQAMKSMVEARMGYAAGIAEASFNRRHLTTAGKGWTNPGPQDTGILGREGPEDTQVQTLWFEDCSGHLIGLMVNYSAHATLTFSEMGICADFPGEIRRVVQAAYGEDLPVLYLQGACGNTSPINFDQPEMTPTGFAGARKIGQCIGDEVNKILADRSQYLIDDPRLAAAAATFDVPVRGLGDDDPKPEDALVYIHEHPLDRMDLTAEPDMFRWYFANCMVEMEYGSMKRDSWPVGVSVLRIGPVILAANPAELFVEYQLAIKERSDLPVMVSELTNGYCGYILTERAWKNGKENFAIRCNVNLC